MAQKKTKLSMAHGKDLYKFGADFCEPGENTKYLSHALEVQAMPKIDYTDPEQVEKRINDYLLLCVKNDVKPSVQGYANAIGVSRITIFDWHRGKWRAGTHQEIISRGYDILASLWEDYMLNGRINPVSGIFLGKNFFGLTDRQEISVKPGEQMEHVAAEEIAAKYAELPDPEANVVSEDAEGED